MPTSFANILAERTDPALDGIHRRVVPLEEWVPHRNLPPVPSTTRYCDEVDEMMDQVFVDFHRELKDYMVTNHGTMQHSEAALLFHAIAPHITVAPQSI